MAERITAREAGVVGVFMLPFVVIGCLIATIAPDAYGQVDPAAFVGRSLAWAQLDLAPYVLKDPPLRYFPLAVVYAIVTPTQSAASALASVYGALSVFVVAPLSVWALARRLGDVRVGIVVLSGLLVNLAWTPTLAFHAPTGAWQYYIALSLSCLVLISTHWMLSASLASSRLRRAIVTGVILGCLGLTQVLFAGVTALIVAVACLFQQRYRTCLITALASLPALCYYLFIPPAREQLLSEAVRRSVAEPLWPMTPREVVFTLGLLFVFIVWYRLRGRLSESDLSGAVLVVVGGIWIYAVFLSAGYLAHIFPILALPLCLIAGTTVAVAEFDARTRISSRPALTQTDGGAVESLMVIGDIPHWMFIIGCVALSCLLTLSLLVIIIPRYPL